MGRKESNQTNKQSNQEDPSLYNWKIVDGT